MAVLVLHDVASQVFPLLWELKADRKASLSLAYYRDFQNRSTQRGLDSTQALPCDAPSDLLEISLERACWNLSKQFSITPEGAILAPGSPQDIQQGRPGQRGLEQTNMERQTLSDGTKHPHPGSGCSVVWQIPC